MLDIKLVRPTMLETSALGVAMVSGHTSGIWTMTGIASPVDTSLLSLKLMARLKKINQWLALVWRRFRELVEGGNMCGGFVVFV